MELLEAVKMLTNGISPKVVELPLQQGIPKVDLADFLQAHSADDLRTLLRRSKTLLDREQGDVTADIETADFRASVVECIAEIDSPLEREQITKELSSLLGVSKAEISKEIQHNRKKEQGSKLPDDAGSGKPYYIKDNQIFMVKTTKESVEEIPLSNFAAQIIVEEIHDDDAERKTYFTIEGTLSDGNPLPEILVPADQYNALKWPIENWGSQAVIYAGTSKDHLRAAIQLLSGNVPQRTIYTHCGWREIGGQWVFLHNDGGIGTEGPVSGVRVALDGRIGNFQLTDPPTGKELIECVHASLQIFDLAPITIAAPIFSAIFRAPLGEMVTNDISIFLTGRTGGQKTELSALAQAHYGSNFDGRHLPGSWQSTDNSLEREAFLLKDGVFVVDDYVPLGTSAETAKLNRKADRLLRGQANSAGRSRLRPDGGKGAEYHPRGVIISSGEDLPRGQSLRARLFAIEVTPGDVDLQKLTEAQENAASGLLAQAMAGYVQWLAPQVNKFKETLPARQKELRDLARTGDVQHDRAPDIRASLALGFEMFLEFAQAVGAITEEEKAKLWQDGWDALTAAAKAQKTLQAEEDFADKFVELLTDAFSAGRAHLVDAKTGGVPKNAEYWGWRRCKPVLGGQSGHKEKKAQGEFIGWVQGDDLMLEPSSTFRAIKKFAVEQNENLPITKNTLWKRLCEKGYLASSAPNKNLAYRIVEGHRCYVVHLSCNTFSLIPGSAGTPGTDTHDESRGVPDS